MDIDVSGKPVEDPGEDNPIEDPKEKEIPVLEYARLQGLCQDYTSEQTGLHEIPTASNDWDEADFRLPIEVSLTDPAEEQLIERLAVTKEAALFLKDVSLLQELPEDALQVELDVRRTRDLKLELPILRTDNELDLADFGNTDVPSFIDLRIPLEILDEENDEGLQFPSKYASYPDVYQAKAQAEKLSMSKEGLLCLQDALTDSWNPKNYEKAIAEDLSVLRSRAIRPLTPPLLPLSPPLTPYVPSSPGNHVPLISDSNDSLAAELKEVTDRLMDENALVPEPMREESEDSMLFDYIDEMALVEEVETRPSPILKRKREDLRVEGPLTPPMFDESPAKKLKTVTFTDTAGYASEFFSTFVPGYADLDDNDNDDSAGFYKQAAPFAEKVKRMVENERLSEVDTLKRVEVPEVDFTMPSPPWEEFSRKANGRLNSEVTELDAQRHFLTRVQRYIHKSTPSWSGVAKLERQLAWAAFPIQMARVSIEEKLHGEENITKLLSELSLGDIATSSTDLWNRDGLRVLEDDDSEDELEVADFGPKQNLETMVRKRKLETDEENDGNADGPNKKAAAPPVRDRAHDDTESATEMHRGPDLPHKSGKRQHIPAKQNTDDGLMFGGRFSATSAIETFMALHGKTITSNNKQNDENSAHFAPPAPPMFNKKRAPSITDSTLPLHEPQVHSVVALPELPSVPENLPPCSFIISSTLWRQRGLARELKELYHNAVFIERDFTLSHSPAEEADLILSPSAGLIFTTLQQVKQRALPGQRDRSPIKERIIALQARYERLIVLISEGLTREAEKLGSGRPVDDRDKDALAEFKVFTDKMGGEVQGKYVQGGELALSRTMVQEMAQWGLVHGSTDLGELRLLEEETTWEVFLRRTGLNPYAAQVILASLKGPFVLPLTSSSPYNSDESEKVISMKSLAAFIYLSSEERVQRFQTLLGGTRILGRVNALLEKKWVSAANGFQIGQ